MQKIGIFLSRDVDKNTHLVIQLDFAPGPCADFGLIFHSSRYGIYISVDIIFSTVCDSPNINTYFYPTSQYFYSLYIPK